MKVPGSSTRSGLPILVQTTNRSKLAPSSSISSHSCFAMKLATVIPTKLFKLCRKCMPRSRSKPDHIPFPSNTAPSSFAGPGLRNPDGVLSTSKCAIPSADVYAELKQVFEMIDSDGDGKIGREELQAVLSRLGEEPPTEEELREMLGEVDGDGDGFISLEEFCAIGPAFAEPACDSELRNVFNFFDANRDGKITAEELADVLKVIGDTGWTLEDCRRMIGGVDRAGEGCVCFQDFSRMMMQGR